MKFINSIMNRSRYILFAFLVICLFGGFSAMSHRTEKDGWYMVLDSENLPQVKPFEGLTGKIVITETIDLKRQEAILPEDVTLVFKKSGRITNGRLVGNNTKVVYGGAVFDRVRIHGTWVIPNIRTSMFSDLNYENSLKDVMALSNPEVKNVIVIEKGDYHVTAQRNEDVCLPVNSNTTLTINGTILLTPNNFRNYYIIQAIGENITINGSGTIIGDKPSHTGKDGEWGMGIELMDAHHVQIKDLTIKDCWGDCIYVGDGSTNVKISHCKLDNGRRQGISITSGENIAIKDCVISNVGGTNPEYAIDVEPNKGDTVRNVVIENVTSLDCMGGFLVWGKAPKALVDGVIIKRSSVENARKCPISLESSHHITVKNCIADATTHRTFVSCKNVTNSTVAGNKFKIKTSLTGTLTKAFRRSSSEDTQTVFTENCSHVISEANELVEWQ